MDIPAARVPQLRARRIGGVRLCDPVADLPGGVGVRTNKYRRLKASEPVHITLRVADDVARLGLRKRSVYKAVREAMIVTLGRETCRIVHLSIQDNHVHLLVEADDRMALARAKGRSFPTAITRRSSARRARRETRSPTC
jgi:REP element-mobilizing transposase RayT